MTGISLDYRTGSGELEPYFAAFGIEVVKKKLDYGDFSFEGRGPHGHCAIVVERKRIEELVAAIQSRRLSGHQLPGMAEQYDYCYLIVEGVWHPDPDGQLEIGYGSMDGAERFGGQWRTSFGKGMHYRAVDNYLSTLELQAGVIYRRTMSAAETVFQVVDLYRWWQDKEWAAHTAHQAVYAPAAMTGRRILMTRRDVSLLEKIAMQLPGLDAKAERVAAHFGTLKAMVAASEADWTEIKGIGKASAKRLVRALG
jgi:ERCC4-type nuclease